MDVERRHRRRSAGRKSEIYRGDYLIHARCIKPYVYAYNSELPYFIMRCHHQEGLTDCMLVSCSLSVLYSASFLSRTQTYDNQAATQEAENSHRPAELVFLFTVQKIVNRKILD